MTLSNNELYKEAKNLLIEICRAEVKVEERVGTRWKSKFIHNNILNRLLPLLGSTAGYFIANLGREIQEYEKGVVRRGHVHRLQLPDEFSKLRETVLFWDFFAGLLEGDGSIYFESDERAFMGISWVLSIAFHKDDTPIAEKLQKVFGLKKSSLTISATKKDPNNKGIVLRIYGIEQLRYIATHINGKLRGPKYPQLKLLMHFLNNHPSRKERPLLVSQPITTKSLYSNGWFAGFYQADGWFAKEHRGFGVAQTLYSKTFGFHCGKFMLSLANFFCVNVVDYIKKEGYRTLIFESSHPSFCFTGEAPSVYQYFLFFPLLGSKYADFLLVRAFDEKSQQEGTTRKKIYDQWKEEGAVRTHWYDSKEVDKKLEDFFVPDTRWPEKLAEDSLKHPMEIHPSFPKNLPAPVEQRDSNKKENFGKILELSDLCNSRLALSDQLLVERKKHRVVRYLTVLGKRLLFFMDKEEKK
jgi:hypothetical protein